MALHPVDLNEPELAFIAASEDLDRTTQAAALRSARRLRRSLVAVATIAAFALIAGGLAWGKRREATHSRRVADAAALEATQQRDAARVSATEGDRQRRAAERATAEASAQRKTAQRTASPPRQSAWPRSLPNSRRPTRHSDYYSPQRPTVETAATRTRWGRYRTCSPPRTPSATSGLTDPARLPLPAGRLRHGGQHRDLRRHTLRLELGRGDRRLGQRHPFAGSLVSGLGRGDHQRGCRATSQSAATRLPGSTSAEVCGQPISSPAIRRVRARQMPWEWGSTAQHDSSSSSTRPVKCSYSTTANPILVGHPPETGPAPRKRHSSSSTHRARRST